jgi:hypothetical protein
MDFFKDIKTVATVLHVLAAVCAMGAALASDVLFNFYRTDKKLSRMELQTLAALSRFVWYGLIAVIISGIAIFLSDSAYYLASSKFLTKMTITGLLIVNGFILDRFIWRHLLHVGFFVSEKEKIMRRAAFVCGTISVISWISVLTLGVLDSMWFSYGAVMGTYGGIVAVGVGIALAVE